MSSQGKASKSPKTNLMVKGSPLGKKDREVSESSASQGGQDFASFFPAGMFSKALMKKCNALKNLQVELTEIEAKFYDELHKLECKYAVMQEPLYEKRKKIITGEYEPTAEEIKWAYDEEEGDLKEEADGEKTPSKQQGVDESKLTPSAEKLLKDLKSQLNISDENEENIKGVKDFWLTTLQSFQVTKDIVQEHDEPILSYLTDIRVKLSDKPVGYTFEFEFAENPYFSNKTLTKTYELKNEVDKRDPFSYDGPSLGKSAGCKIEWKSADKNVTVKLVKKKLKSKNKKVPPKVITKEEKQDSFFNFFDELVGGDATGKHKRKTSESGTASSGAEDSKQLALKKKQHDDDEEGDEEDDEELYKMADFEIAEFIKDKVVPRAILYFTGEYDDEDEEYEDYDDEEDEDYDDEEDEDAEDDDEEEEEEHHHGKHGKKGGAAHKHPGGGVCKSHHGHPHAHPHPHGGAKMTNGKPGETPAECKQQ